MPIDSKWSFVLEIGRGVAKVAIDDVIRVDSHLLGETPIMMEKMLLLRLQLNGILKTRHAVR
jgi:hypothetical protein